MVYALYGRDKDQHRATFSSLSRLRHDVFIKHRRWSLPCRDDAEVDQYDTAEAVYLFDYDASGAVKAHVRLTPTMIASLTADYFPHLNEKGVSLRDPAICEATRFMILPTQRDKSSYKMVKAAFVAAVTEWCIEHGYAFMQTVIDAGTLSSYVEVTPLTTPLGLPHPFGGGRKVPGGGECLAIRLPMGRAILEDIYAYGAISDPAACVVQNLPREAA